MATGNLADSVERTDLFGNASCHRSMECAQQTSVDDASSKKLKRSRIVAVARCEDEVAGLRQWTPSEAGDRDCLRSSRARGLCDTDCLLARPRVTNKNAGRSRPQKARGQVLGERVLNGDG